MSQHGSCKQTHCTHCFRLINVSHHTTFSALAVIWATITAFILAWVAADTLEYTAQPEVPPSLSLPGSVVCSVCLRQLTMFWNPVVPPNLPSVTSFLNRKCHAS